MKMPRDIAFFEKIRAAQFVYGMEFQHINVSVISYSDYNKTWKFSPNLKEGF
jgi:hypothetical protein